MLPPTLIGQNIKKIGEIFGKSEQSMGGILGISQQAINKKINGKSRLYVEDIMKLAEAFKIAPEVFLFDFSGADVDQMKEIIDAYTWIQERPGDQRRKILRLGIMSFKMFTEESQEDILITPHLRPSLPSSQR